MKRPASAALKKPAASLALEEPEAVAEPAASVSNEVHLYLDSQKLQ